MTDKSTAALARELGWRKASPCRWENEKAGLTIHVMENLKLGLYRGTKPVGHRMYPTLKAAMLAGEEEK